MDKSRLNREVWGVVACLAALLITISLLTYHPADRSFNTPSGRIETHNWGGFAGAYIADLLLQGFGVSSYLLPIFLCLAGLQMFRAQFKGIAIGRSMGYGVLFVGIGVLISMFADSENAREAGG